MSGKKSINPNDLPKYAKALAKKHGLPVPNVAQIMMKYPLDKKGYVDKVSNDCAKLRAAEMKKDLQKMGFEF